MKKYLLLPILLSLIVCSSFLNAGINHYQLTLGSVTVSEADGTASLTIRVDPKIVDNNENITVDFKTASTVPVDAVAGSDYVSQTGSVTLRKGVQTSDISITIQNDSLPESQEIFNVIIENADLHQSATTGNDVNIAIDTGSITIDDDDGTGTTPTISVTNKTVDEDAGVATFTVTRSLAATADVTFTYATDDITATQGKDYTLTSGTGTIPVGGTSTQIQVPIIDDKMAGEGDETFTFFISNPSTGTELGNALATGTIVDDDTDLSLAINDASIAEGDADIIAIIKVLFSEALPNDLNITYETRDGTSVTIDNATAGNDYIAISSTTVTVPAGSSEFDLNVTIIGDDTGESVEEFYIGITNVNTSGGIVTADDTSIITIFDDDNAGGCSSHSGLITINEYQNNPNYKDDTHPLANQAGMVPGNYVEIKYIDFLVKQYVNDLWNVSIYTTAGTASLNWDEKDLKCTDPRYEIFEMTNHVMGAQGYVVMTDENGNEVDVLNIDNSNHYNPNCTQFPYDTDFDSDAQNKDLFRVPDGTGDWFDHGSGANSGGSRCVNMDGSQDEILYTEFDAIDIDETPNTPIGSGADVPIKTKVVNDSFSLNILSLEVTDPTTIGNLKNSSVTIKVYLADPDGNRLPGSVNTAKDVVFTNSTTVRVDDFIYDQAIKVAHVAFEYCGTVTGATANWDTCYNTGNTDNDILQRRALSRNAFAIRPDKFNVNITSGEILTAGELLTGLSFTALDGSTATPAATPLYNEIENISFTVDVKIRDITKVCQNQDINMTPDVVAFTDGVDPRDFIFNDVGDVNMTIKEIDGAEFAQVDLTDTPDTTLRFIEPFNVDFTLVPDHFTIDANLTDHNKDSNLTYLHDMNSTNDYSMGAVLSVDIKAMGADGQITRNYMETCYAKDTNLTLALDTINITYPGATEALTQFLYYNPVEDNGTADSGEGYHPLPTPVTDPIPSLPIENSTASFPSDAPNGHGTTHIEYKLNFDRKQNLEVNPFQMNLTDVDIIDEDGIAGTKGAITNQNANLYYARTRPSKPFYDDNIESSTATPIAIDVYCDLGFTACKNIGDLTPQDDGIDTTEAQLNVINWWISLGHVEDGTQHDGNVTLQIGNVIVGAGSPSVSPTNVQIVSEGKNENITVTSNATTLPMTVEIELVNNIDPLSPGYSAVASPYTNNWLIYNKNSATAVPEPFYKVRFIDISDWAGVGETGYVLDTNASSRKTKRLDW